MSVPSRQPASPLSPLSALQQSLRVETSVRRFDRVLRAWSRNDPDLAGIGNTVILGEVLGGRDYQRHDAVLFSLLRRAATLGREGMTATEIVVSAMLPAVPGITGRVIRASRAAASCFGSRRGVTAGGVSASDANADIQATVIGHLWEQVRCYPLRRRSHVAANLVRETQRAALRGFGVDCTQAAADVASFDAEDLHHAALQPAGEVDASKELLELLSWAVEQKRLDEQATAILVARYFGDEVGRDGVATDRQVAKLLGVSQPTLTRWRNRVVEQLAEAAQDFPGCGLPWAG